MMTAVIAWPAVARRGEPMTSQSAKPRAPAQSPFEGRAAALRVALGQAPKASRPLADAIRGVTRSHFTRHVEPLVRRHAPSLMLTPFMDKLRIGACDLYAVAPYLALVCGDRAPAPLRATLTAADWLPLDDDVFARLAGRLVTLIGHHVLQRAQRQIARVAAFVVVVDHALDHGMAEAPRARGRRLKAILRGTEAPDSELLALSHALVAALRDDAEGSQRQVLEAALGHIDAWIDAEVRALSGEQDASGLCHRRAGVEGTIEGLLFPVEGWAGPAVRAWLTGVSMFVQMADDLLDIEHDLRDGRMTPATEGRWTIHEVEAAWHETVAGLHALARRSVPGARRFSDRVTGAYRVMMVELVGAMIARPEDGC
jgi:hypothetical protein